jgi:glycosyltransferase involved in cell wall biosynthesis
VGSSEPVVSTVLHVVHYPVFGGPHNQALRLAAPLRSSGWETVALLPDHRGNAAQRLEASGIEVITIPLHRLRATANPLIHVGFYSSLVPEVMSLRRVIRRRGVDVVQIAGLVNPHAALAARLEGVPVVWQLLDTRAPRPVAAVAMMFVRSLADVVMSTGVAVAKAHPGYSAIAERVIPFFPPVDLARFAPHPEIRSDVRASWGVPSDAFVIGCVANINPQKGIVDLVRSFAQMRVAHQHTRLVLVGAEHETHRVYSADVRAAVEAADLVEGTDVIFAGEQTDVEWHLAGMDVLALAAVPRSEGITTAVLEGMASGLPVVVTDVGALREAVDHGRTGFVVEANHPDIFATALVRLLEDHALRLRMGRAGRAFAEERFGLATCAETHIRAYQQALATGGGRGRSWPGRR